MDKALIARVTKEVLARLGDAQHKSKKGTLAVFAGYVFDEALVTAYLQSRCENVTCALFGEAVIRNAAFRVASTASPEERQSLAGQLGSYDSFVIVTPPLSYIEAVAAANDERFEAMLALRPLLWGKSVTLLLDFALPRSKRAFTRLSDSLDTLEQMGMAIEMLASGDKSRKELVTEQDVKDAARQMQSSIRIAPNAIVTQLARDTAKETGISIEL